MKSLLALLMMTAAGPALAEDKPADEAAKKKKVIRLDALTVEGKIQKPQAFYILQRSNLNFEDLNRPESFVPQVVESVDKQPF
jgi:hypothetical protein